MEFEVTRNTIRNAIRMLSDNGKIYTLKGKGSFIAAPKIEQSLFKFYSFGRNYPKSDYNVETSLLKLSYEKADSNLSQKLEINENSTVIRIERLRKLNTTPLIVEVSYIPEQHAPDIEKFNLDELSIYDLLESEFNHKITRAKEYLDPSITDEYYGTLLGIGKNVPVFLTERVTYSENNKPLEYRKSIIRGDKFRFSVDLNL